LVFRFVLVPLVEFLEAADNLVLGFGDREADEVVGAHVECLHARKVAGIPNLETCGDVCGHYLLAVLQGFDSDQTVLVSL